MFAPFIIGFERKPAKNWIFEDNKITGVCAFVDYVGIEPRLILPHGISDETRDLLLWAYESGEKDGQWRGARELRGQLKSLLRINEVE